MKLISSVIICLGLSACATDYVSRLSQPNYGIRSLHCTEGAIDPTLLMNGTYASKQMNGLSVSTPWELFARRTLVVPHSKRNSPHPVEPKGTGVQGLENCRHGHSCRRLRAVRGRTRSIPDRARR